MSKTLTPITVTTVALVALSLSASAHANPQRAQAQAQAQADFQAADVDKNGRLTFAEFKTFINLNAEHNLGRAASIRRFGLYTKVFQKADADGDGVVTKEEIAAQVQQ